MTSHEREQMRTDIAETFAFVRFILKNPKMLKKIRNGSEVKILPFGAGLASSSRVSRGVQVFTAETVFHSL